MKLLHCEIDIGYVMRQAYIQFRAPLKFRSFSRKDSYKEDNFNMITMIITIAYVLIELLVLTQTQFRDILCLQSNNVESKNSSLSMFYLMEVSIVECGSLCLSNQCCKEFLYSIPNQQCIGVHFPDFQSNSSNNTLVFSTYEGMLPYKKGTYVLLQYLMTTFGT